ncbi:MAG: NADH-quinone oxidoreductase subunit NuoG [Rickettsiaceae bacterium]
MIKIIIDNIEHEIESGITVMQACNRVGIEIPHFCYHKKLKIAGNCRMCLVNMEKSPKPIASCAAMVQDGMVIHTNTQEVKKTREAIMELLLINHPLDCPICDQGGECDLQDEAFKYGAIKNRFKENKRAVENKDLGPLIKTSMNRCIHCTRCIRFATDVAGVEELGALYRGEHMEITNYLEKTLASELSGNIIDLCPVGALTSKPYEFKARSWELKKTNSIDILDAVGSNIRIDSIGNEVMRILPNPNDEINEEWISDKIRFSYDGLKYQRLDYPYVRKNGKLIKTSWQEALETIKQRISTLEGNQIAAIAGKLVPVEPMFLLKNLLKILNCDNITANQFNYVIDCKSRGNYLFNTEIANINQSDLCLLIGSNPRHTAPIINTKIGQAQRSGSMHVARIGESNDQTYKIQELGHSPDLLESILNEKHAFSKQLKEAKKPMIIIGDGLYSRKDAKALFNIIYKIVDKYNIVKDDWNGFNIMHNHSSIIGANDIGFVQRDDDNIEHILRKTKSNIIKCVYLLGSDDVDMSAFSSAFVIYQGHHGDVGAYNADVILPTAAYSEQDGIFVNLEGRPQYSRKAIEPLGEAKPDWLAINELAQVLNINLKINSIEDIRALMSQYSKIFANINQTINCDISYSDWNDEKYDNTHPIQTIETNYYMTDVITKHSVTMAKCIETHKDECK